MKIRVEKKKGILLGRTTSGKSIYENPIMNDQFDQRDHLDAYRAHAKFMTFNHLDKPKIARHKKAMNLHYLLAVTNL